jgi:hypothetical protein
MQCRSGDEVEQQTTSWGGGSRGVLGRRKPVGAPAPCPTGGGVAQSRGRVGAAHSRARSWCAQHNADQEKWRLPLGILS